MSIAYVKLYPEKEITKENALQTLNRQFLILKQTSISFFLKNLEDIQRSNSANLLQHFFLTKDPYPTLAKSHSQWPTKPKKPQTRKTISAKKTLALVQ